jgi:hypothetical protein
MGVQRQTRDARRRIRLSRQTWTIGLAVLWVCGLADVTWAQARAANPAQLKILHGQYLDLREAYQDDLRRLKQDCEAQGFTDAVAEIERYQQIPDRSRIQLSTLPDRMQPPIPADLPEAEYAWRTRLLHRREEYAKQLYLLSRRMLNAGSAGQAYDLLHELIVHDPDHKNARNLLGYVTLGDEWVTPFAQKMRLKRFEWHPEFGWLPKGHAAKYAAGERFVAGKWMSAEKEAAIRQDFQHAWEISTDHYLIRTNYSLERGVELAQALEDFHEFFHQAFAGFFLNPEQLGKIFDGTARTVSKNPKQYLVHYYRSREEYVSRLEPVFPTIQTTNGIYLTNDRTAHFYHDPQGQGEDTLFHEATHQILYESHLQHRPIAESEHFWIVEGIACYFESFRRDADGFSIGDPGHIRFAGARMNYLDKEYYVPLEEFAALGRAEYQGLPVSQLTKNYTQAAGLAHFFMQYDGGRYRDAVVGHLGQIYSGDARKRQFTQGLNDLTGVSYPELDRQYGEWLRELRAAESRPAASVPPEP